MTESTESVPDGTGDPAPGGRQDQIRQKKWIALAVKRPVAVLMIATAIVVFGAISLSRLPMDLMPEISYPTVTIRAAYPGAAPEDVEDRVARRLEQSLSVVKGVQRVTSVSKAESADVILEFVWGTDVKAAVQDIREKLDQTFLPDEVERPTILRYDPRLDPVLQVGIVGVGWEPRMLRQLVEEEVERPLETVAGVAAVRVRGGLEEEIRVEVDESKTRSRGIAIADIAQRLAEENLDQAAGLLREGNVSYIVRTRNEMSTLEEMESLPLRRDGDSVVRLGDVATVTAHHRKETVITRIAGEPAILVEVYREADANIVTLAEKVKERLQGTAQQRRQLKKWRAQGPNDYVGSILEDEKSDGDDAATEDPDEATSASLAGESDSKRVRRPDFIGARLPESVDQTVLSDQSTFIGGAIGDLRQTAILGALIAMLVLYAFLGRVLLTAIVALSIPFSVVATFAPMHLGGISLNIMSLGGLALGVGMLVDSSIVVLEAIFRQREVGSDPVTAAIDGASQVGGAVFASTLTTIAVFFPIVFVEGVAGQVFRDQALTVIYSLLASLVASLTLVPALAARVPDRQHRALGGERSQYFTELTLFPIERPTGLGSLILFPLRVLYYVGVLFIELTLLFMQGCYFLFCLVVQCIGGVAAWVGGKLAALPKRAVAAVIRMVEAIYVRVLRGALRHRGIVLLLGALSLWGAYALSGRVGSELIPSVAQGELDVAVRYRVGTPVLATAEFVRPLERSIAAIPGVRSVSATIGVDPEDVEAGDVGEHTARLRLRLQAGVESPEAVERRVIDRLEEILRGVTHEVSRPVLFSFKTPIEVEIRGHDLEQLSTLAGAVSERLVVIGGLRDVRSNIARGHPECHLFPDREKMALYGVTSRQLADVLRRKNVGEVATLYRSNDRKVDVRVQVDERDRSSLQELLTLVVVPRENGGGWTVNDLIHGYEFRAGPSEIRRIGQQRAAVVSASLSGLDLGRVSDRIESDIYESVELPAEFDIAVGGQKTEMEKSRASLLGALALAIFLVYVVMASQFESLLQPLIILFTIPLAAAGVMLTLTLTGTTLSVISFIGMIVLAGIVVNNAIVLIDLVNQLRGDGATIYDALVEAGRRRLRPILMTTLTTVLGMVPLTGMLGSIPHPESLEFIFGTGQGAEIRAPLAYTVMGGLMSSTLLTLVVIPVVYSLFCRERQAGASTVATGSTPA